MLDLKVRFTGPKLASDCLDTIDVQFTGSQRAAVTTSALAPYGSETVAHRNYRLRNSAHKIGAMIAEQICSQLREMGHAV